MKIIRTTTDLPREEWLRLRKKGIGGSDAAAVAGLSPWVSPSQVWLEKTGRVEPEDLSENEAVYWGTRLEDIVADEFKRRTGMWVQRKNAFVQHSEYPFMVANLDRIIRPTRGKGEWGVLEIKTSNAFAAGQWTEDEIPGHYMLQVQHYLAVTGYSYGYVAVLIGGNTYRHWRIERDEVLIKDLVAVEQAFWENHVLKNTPPPMDGSEASSEVLDRLYPAGKTEEETVPLPAKAAGLIDQYNKAAQQERAFNLEKERAKNELKALLGNHQVGSIGHHRVCWREYKRRFLDVDRLRTEYPEIYEMFSKSRPYRRFSLAIVDNTEN